MYLHLGADVVIRLQEVVGIFDIENATVGKGSKEFLSVSQRKGFVINVTDELPKSFVVCEKDGKTTVYISQISSSTLLRRTTGLDKMNLMI